MKRKKIEIDFDDPRLIEAIEEFDVVNFLQENGVEHSENAKNVGKNYIGIEECPSCSKSNYHAAIHKESKFLTCFVCKCYYSPIKWISYYKRCRFEDTIKDLIDSVEFELDVVERVKSIFRKKERVKESYKGLSNDQIIESKQITIDDLRRSKILKSFFKSRRLCLWHCRRYDLRIGTKRQDKTKIIFPIYTQGVCVANQWRSITHKQYHLSPNAGKYLYDMDNINQDKILLVVEGFLDYVTMDSYLRTNGLKETIMATTGMVKALSAEQIDILNKKRPRKVIFMFDGDSWFDYLKVKNKLLVDADFVILPKDKDPNSMTWQEIKNTLQEVFQNET